MVADYSSDRPINIPFIDCCIGHGIGYGHIDCSVCLIIVGEIQYENVRVISFIIFMTSLSEQVLGETTKLFSSLYQLAIC